jgi:hypothetical protein
LVVFIYAALMVSNIEKRVCTLEEMAPQVRLVKNYETKEVGESDDEEDQATVFALGSEGLNEQREAENSKARYEQEMAAL